MPWGPVGTGEVCDVLGRFPLQSDHRSQAIDISHAVEGTSGEAGKMACDIG